MTSTEIDDMIRIIDSFNVPIINTKFSSIIDKQFVQLPEYIN
jgi:hypothetical protein